MKADKDRFPFLALSIPENPNSIWLLTTLQLSRNLENFAFPSALSPEDRELLRTRLCSKIKGTCIKAEEIGPLEKEFLYEHFLSPRSFSEAGKGDGFIINETLFITINIENHLTTQVMDTKEKIESAFKRLVELESVAQYAFSPRFGYLTSNPQECGTALIGRLYLHTPALIHTGALHPMLENLEEMEASSLQGELDDVVGNLLILRNRCTIGLTEENILEQLRTAALKVLVAEKRARKEIAQQPDIKDKVARAYGLAIHSYQLEAAEVWGALSLLKLGLDLGFVMGTSHMQLNELLFTCRRAHLVAEYGVELSQEELSHRRADYLHGSLQNAQLNI